MPLTRYEIRNEYGLADAELYRAANKDDPEALLEGVAMAGLVGVLRQLGDLAEFAAEIFHGLHEEAMTTAARGHGLMVRAQQLEAEVPSIERAFLSQTNHTPFFSNAGTDWHPNLQTKQSLLGHGDLPRCVMDSYEECRGPPRLFLVDKFDVNGAGACLKRYTDPSFFKATSPGLTGVYKDRKVRKAKKRGLRWRNGDIPEVLSKSHPKLQQLLLEERVENGFSNPTHLVKLKRRQLNDPKSRGSYMEKFLGTPSPENKMVREIYVAPPALKLTPDSCSEAGLEVVEIRTMSSVEKSSQGRKNSLSPPPDHELVKSPIEEFNGYVTDRQIVPLSEPSSDAETDEVPSTQSGIVFEKEVLVDAEGNIEGSINREHSDDMTSDVENYMDALANIESEVDTDNEYRSKNYQGLSNDKKSGTDSDENVEQFKVQAHYSDSQSIEVSSVSDDGNGSFKRERYSFSCSDTLSNLAENAPYDEEAAPKVFSTIEVYEAASTDAPSNKHHAHEISDKKLRELENMSDMQSDDGKNGIPGETYTNPFLQPANSGPNSLVVSSVGPALSQSFLTSPGMSENLSGDSAERNSLWDLNGEDSNVFSTSSLVSEDKSRDNSLEESLQIDHVDETCAQELVEANIVSRQSIISPAEDQFSHSAELPVEDLGSDTMELSHHLEQFPDRADDVLQEPDVPCSEEHINLTHVSTMADKDVADNISSNPPADHSCNAHINSGDIVTEIVEANMTVSSVAVDDDDDNEVVNLSEESYSCSADLLQEEMKSNKAFSPERSLKSEAARETTQSEVASSDVESSLSVSHGSSNNGKLDNICDLKQPHDSFLGYEFPTAPTSSELGYQDMESESPHQNHLSENESDAISSSYCPPNEPVTSSEQSSNLWASKVEIVCRRQAYEASSSSHLQSGQIQLLNNIEQETYFHVDSDSCQKNLHQSVVSECSPQLMDQELVDGAKASEISVSEMQPAPPLPPMQWRMGKDYDFPQDLQGALGQHSQHSFPSMSLFTAHNKTQDGVAMQPGNPFMDPEAVEDVKLHVSEVLTIHLVQPTLLSSHSSTFGNEHELPGLGSENPETDSKLHSAMRDAEDSSLGQGAISSDEKLIRPFPKRYTAANTRQLSTHDSEAEHGYPPAKGEENPHLQTLEGLLSRPSNRLALAPTFEVEKPNVSTVPKIPRPRSPLVDALAAHDKSTLKKVTDRRQPQIEQKFDEREFLLEQFRKTTDRPRPQIEQKADERNSFLEQIKTKSFNLKPALVSRPSTQAPQTNLRLAAILEKANAIRQATAGSDEDDEDSWNE